MFGFHLRFFWFHTQVTCVAHKLPGGWFLVSMPKWNILYEQSQSRVIARWIPTILLNVYDFWAVVACESHHPIDDMPSGLKKRLHVGNLNSSRAWRSFPFFYQIGFLGDLGIGDVKTVGDMKFKQNIHHFPSLKRWRRSWNNWRSNRVWSTRSLF